MRFSFFRYATLKYWISATLMGVLLFGGCIVYLTTHATPNCYLSFYELPQSVTIAHPVFQTNTGASYVVTMRVSLLYSNTCQSSIARYQEAAPPTLLANGTVYLYRDGGKGLPYDSTQQDVFFPGGNRTATSLPYPTDTPGLVSPYSLVQACYVLSRFALCTPKMYAQRSVTATTETSYVAIARLDAAHAGISPEYFVRQISEESGFDPNALSHAGAIGIAQFEPGTAAGLDINPYDPIQSLSGAARLMASYTTQYNGDYAKALAAYNAGEGTLADAIHACGTSWLTCMPIETRNYISKIMGM